MFKFFQYLLPKWRRFKNINVQRGHCGEIAAAKFLKRSGYRILDKNWRSGRYELDLVAYKAQCYVFVEVRGRGKSKLVNGYASVDKHKKVSLRKAILSYLKCHRKIQSYRFDIISIQWDNSGKITDLQHYENVAINV